MPKHWMPVEGFGLRGEYEVTDGYVTVRIGRRTARAAASSARVPASLGMEADKSLAQVLLGEIKID